MIFSVSILAAIFVAALGGVILWANPRRRVNQTVCSCSLHGALWLLFRHVAVVSEDGLIWFRFTTAIGAFFPLHLWIVKQSIIRTEEPLRNWARSGATWLAVTLALAGICFTDFFIPSYSTDADRSYGTGYYIHVIGLLSLYVVLGRQMYSELRTLKGVQRLELQIWLGGGIGACACVVLLMAASVALGSGQWMVLRPLVVICFFAITTAYITTSRVFDAKHLVFLAIERTVLVLTVAGCASATYLLLRRMVPVPLALVATTGGSLYVANALHGLLNRALQRYPRASEARSKALSAAMREMRPEPLTESFLGILRGWAKSERAVILCTGESGFSGEGITIASDSRLLATLRDLSWATPERLARERETADRTALGQFLAQHDLGVLVNVASTGFSIMVGVGVRATRRPYTYPEVQQLQELSSIFQTALARSHLWNKAQRAEQLATVGVLGASVAHEIRNPLVTIKSFVHLLPQHYEDRVFRERFFRLISEEVGRIDRLTEQLLDLAAPRHYNPVPTSLHQVISSSLELVATKAEERQTELHRDLQASPDIVLTDPNASRQVLLNLCFNGIQAQETSKRERWLRLSTRNVPRGVELCVADHGPGISAEGRTHLFQAFHSTKSSGFGLGLAICNEILSSLEATISLDPYVEGEGAVFRIVFPCPPPTS